MRKAEMPLGVAAIMLSVAEDSTQQKWLFFCMMREPPWRCRGIRVFVSLPLLRFPPGRFTSLTLLAASAAARRFGVTQTKQYPAHRPHLETSRFMPHRTRSAPPDGGGFLTPSRSFGAGSSRSFGAGSSRSFGGFEMTRKSFLQKAGAAVTHVRQEQNPTTVILASLQISFAASLGSCFDASRERITYLARTLCNRLHRNDTQTVFQGVRLRRNQWLFPHLLQCFGLHILFCFAPLRSGDRND